MKIILELTEDHIKLIKALKVERIGTTRVGIDRFGLYGGTYLFEDMAFILGKQDKVIPETLESPMGAEYEEGTMQYLNKLANDMEEHLEDYEAILHQFCDKGGLKPGKYICQDNVRIWNFEEE